MAPTRWILPAALLAATLAPANIETRRTPVVTAVEKALPAVVNISTERMVQPEYSDPYMRWRGEMMDRFLREYFGQARPPGQGLSHSLGSGVVVDEQGYILTNYHVIERASAIRVMMADNTIQDAIFIAGDETSDLALIKVQPDAQHPLKAALFAMDDDLLLGETVIALGNPYGLTHSVSAGVLSAKNREARVGGEVVYRDILQTDAPVNPGNSGGPLLNIDGEVIGLNVAVWQEAQNIGFAVPIKRCRDLLGRWFEPRLLRGLTLGFETEAGPSGLRVSYLIPDSEAAKAGIVPGAEILALNGAPVRELYGYHKALLPLAEGTRVKIRWKSLGDARETELALTRPPRQSGNDLAKRFLGLSFKPDIAGTDVPSRFRNCLPIETVAETGAGKRAGLTPGLLVMRINDQDIRNLDDVARALDRMRRGDPVTLTLVRFSERQQVIIAQTARVQMVAD